MGACCSKEDAIVNHSPAMSYPNSNGVPVTGPYPIPNGVPVNLPYRVTQIQGRSYPSHPTHPRVLSGYYENVPSIPISPQSFSHNPIPYMANQPVYNVVPPPFDTHIHGSVETMPSHRYGTPPSVFQRQTQFVLGIDFGTTESGFAFCARPFNGEQINIANIATNETWPGIRGQFKTNTVLEYDQNWNVTQWGYPALAQRQSIKKNANSFNTQILDRKPVELFKLHLGDMPEEEKPPLPVGLHFKKAIKDYLSNFGKLVKSTLSRQWPHMNFHEDVQIVMTVPAEFQEKTKVIMRSAAFEAGLINKENSENLIFTTEPEAAAIYCLHYIKEYPLRENEPFMIVDCGGGTVDLTTRMLLPGRQISEITMRSGEFCGSSYVDREFLKYLSRCLGLPVIRHLQDKHYSQLQYLIQEFFVRRVKTVFTGKPSEFSPIILDIEDYCPAAIQYVTPQIRAQMEEAQWQISLEYETVKAMFDPIIDNILTLIDNQIKSSSQPPQGIFLVGGFGNSIYVYNKVQERFGNQNTFVCVAHQPITAIVRGAVLVGVNVSTVVTRVLKWTYGIECYRNWTSMDPPERRDEQGRVKGFDRLATRGKEVEVNEKFKGVYSTSYPGQTHISFPVYVTSAENATYCDGLKFLGTLEIDIPVDQGNDKREIEFSLLFGQMEIKASALVVKTGLICATTFKFDEN
ncbi:hypothetical protein G9A89_016183 [Geosiphon pyriformis]|nr:hypothetical protein G9A89_016183 [Geosiphon pyriformis]